MYVVFSHSAIGFFVRLIKEIYELYWWCINIKQTLKQLFYNVNN